jgi:hypothetical protein
MQGLLFHLWETREVPRIGSCLSTTFHLSTWISWHFHPLKTIMVSTWLTISSCPKVTKTFQTTYVWHPVSKIRFTLESIVHHPIYRQADRKQPCYRYHILSGFFSRSIYKNQFCYSTFVTLVMPRR